MSARIWRELAAAKEAPTFSRGDARIWAERFEKAAAIASSQEARAETAEAKLAEVKKERDEAREEAADHRRVWNEDNDKIDALTKQLEAMRGAVYEKVGECLAGKTHAEVSIAARKSIKRALDAALTTENQTNG